MMKSPLFPKTIDNTYRGSWIAIWLMAPILLMKALIGVNSSGLNPWVSTEFVMMKADGIPLETFSAEAQELSVFLFASWGLGLLLLCLFVATVLIRYRAMLPLAILFLTIEQVGRKILSTLILAPGDPLRFGALINWAFSIALVAAFVMSLTPRREAAAR